MNVSFHKNNKHLFDVPLTIEFSFSSHFKNEFNQLFKYSASHNDTTVICPLGKTEWRQSRSLLSSLVSLFSAAADASISPVIHSRRILLFCCQRSLFSSLYSLFVVIWSINFIVEFARCSFFFHCPDAVSSFSCSVEVCPLISRSFLSNWRQSETSISKGFFLSI